MILLLWRERTESTSVLFERKRKFGGLSPFLCCPGKWSGLNRISHPHWVKICDNHNGQINLHTKQKYEVLSATDLYLFQAYKSYENADSLIQDLNPGNRVHFLWKNRLVTSTKCREAINNCLFWRVDVSVKRLTYYHITVSEILSRLFLFLFCWDVSPA